MLRRRCVVVGHGRAGGIACAVRVVSGVHVARRRRSRRVVVAVQAGVDEAVEHVVGVLRAVEPVEVRRLLRELVLRADGVVREQPVPVPELLTPRRSCCGRSCRWSVFPVRLTFRFTTQVPDRVVVDLRAVCRSSRGSSRSGDVVLLDLDVPRRVLEAQVASWRFSKTYGSLFVPLPDDTPCALSNSPLLTILMFIIGALSRCSISDVRSAQHEPRAQRSAG